jgi:mono/diheme cytochrome c family protein
MKRPIVSALAGLALAALPVGAQVTAPASAARGELLYTTNCIACHTAQVHWRDKRLVTDWASLTAQVNRWQANARLGWTSEEIVDVARYLNATYYRLPDLSLQQQG